MANQKVLTISEVTKLLELHPITVYRLIKQGKLPSFRIGRVLRFDADQIEAWLGARRRKTETKNIRHKWKGPSSAEYLAYGREVTFAPEKLLETFAISRPLLVKSFVEANHAGNARVVCARCRDAEKPIAALLLFASEQAKRHWKKSAMPFCRSCFSALKKLAAPESSGRSALETASKIDHQQARHAATR
jgi:excisionase family DNA binding protein